MPKCEVVGVASRWPDRSKEPYYNHEAWLDSLRRFDAAPSVIGLGEPWGGLITIPRHMRKWLRAGMCKSEFLIFSNCFDVIFTAHPDEVAARWGGGDDVMFNTEKDLFPASKLAHSFPDTGSPWRYLNSGLYIGKPERILAMLDAMWLDELHDDHVSPDELHGGTNLVVNVVDQNWFQLLFAAQAVPITLDTKCECFQTFSSCTWDEFDLSGKQVKNKATGTTPLVLHCNGGAKNEMLPDLCRKFGLTP
jgi:hypothetical protein